jgi:hypothetical protein
MTQHRTSYWKTFLVAASALAMAAALAGAMGSQELGGRSLGFWLAISVLAFPSSMIALGALVALYRDAAGASNKGDLFLALNRYRSEDALAALDPMRAGAKTVLNRLFRSRRLSVGDVVEVRSLDEILGTLDESGRLYGLPFMPEMAPFCGQRFRIYRSVDKIYDYGRSKDLRRLNDSFLLLGLRCSGKDHGGCQAACYLVWKGSWLRRADGLELPRPNSPEHGNTHRDESPRVAEAVADLARGAAPRSGLYTCQYTQLAAASAPMRTWDIRQDLRPLVAGNLTFFAFCVAILTRVFNAAQALRGGVPYPFLPRGELTKTPLVEYGLLPGSRTRVLSAQQIAATLNKTNRNRGLWFDREMLKHCGRSFTVLHRIDRLIDDATGKMLQMKAPCITLAGVDASGEFLRFCAQHEFHIWREAWLSPEIDGTD